MLSLLPVPNNHNALSLMKFNRAAVEDRVMERVRSSLRRCEEKEHEAVKNLSRNSTLDIREPPLPKKEYHAIEATKSQVSIKLLTCELKYRFCRSVIAGFSRGNG